MKMELATDGVLVTDSSKKHGNLVNGVADGYDIKTYPTKPAPGVARLGPLITATQLASAGTYLYYLVKGTSSTRAALPNLFVAAQVIEFGEYIPSTLCQLTNS